MKHNRYKNKFAGSGILQKISILAVALLWLAPVMKAQTTVTKHLYLSDPSQALDRIDPAATSDNTTASTVRLQAVPDGIAVASVSTGQSNSTSSLSFSHTVNSGENRLLLVGIATGASNYNGSNASDVTSVTYRGSSMTLVGNETSSGYGKVFIYALVNPAAGTGNVVVTTNTSRAIVANATSFTGVNQTTPYGSFYSDYSSYSSAYAGLSGISSASDELIYDVVAVDVDRSSPYDIYPDNGQTELWNIPGYSSRPVSGCGSVKTGSASASVGWSWSFWGSQQYAIGAVSLKPVSVTSSTTFTQSPVLCSPLTIKAGQTLSASLYLTVESGTMPSNPAITANLRYGSTLFASSSSPVYNSSTGLLSFTGSLSSDLTIPAGQAISAEIISNQSGAAFRINYDSGSKPSRISLPVSTYVNIDSYEAYNAAYPSGSVLSASLPGTTVYLRAVVSDPFGANDITGLSLTLPSGTVTATQVASSGCTKTYEYAWNTTGVAENNYAVPAIAKEGYENTVTAAASLNLSLCTPIGTPVFSLGATSTRCQSANTIVFGAASANASGITYSLDAASLAAGNTINAATGAVTFVQAWVGNSVITATAEGCAGPKSANHAVTTTVGVTIPVFQDGESSNRCKEAAVVTYAATAENTTGIVYSLDPVSLLAGNAINPSTGAVTYTAAWNGTSVITATAAGCGGPTTATHTVFSGSVVAVDDYVSGTESSAIIINVIANDFCDVNPASLSIVNMPQNGTLQIGTGGQITYLPSIGFFGNDEFVYSICNNAVPQGCDTATVHISVEETMNDACSEATRSKIYYMPFPENDTQLRKSLISAASINALSGDVRSIITVKIPYPGIVITYDHWEDGYEPDITRPQQTSTLIWGDGNKLNGIAPGYPNDIIPPGGYLTLDNSFAYNPRVTSTLVYDGRDKLFSTGDVVVSKITGDAGFTSNVPIFNVQNVKTGVVDVTRFGNYFILPFGEDVTLGGTSSFKYTSVFVRASEDGTVVNLDYNADGVNDVSATLNEGEVWMYDGTSSIPGNSNDVNRSNDIKSGAIITSNYPVGVDMLFGGLDNYGTRNIPVLPGQFYSNSYYTPIYTSSPSGVPVYMFFTNSHNSSITVNWTNRTSSGSVVVPANGYNYYAIPYSSSGTGYKFESQGGETFTAVAVVDADASGSAYDWAYNLMPTDRLTSFTSVAWAPGSNDFSGNYNPVWVTATANTTLYIKYDGNLTSSSPTVSPCGLPYDIAVPLNYLDVYKVYDNSDNDQSGVAVYTCDDTAISAIWGQDSYAHGSDAPTSSPAQDVGYFLEPRCLQQLVFANDDYVVTDPEKEIIIGVASNDFGFLTTLSTSSITTLGLLQPSNGSLNINSDGTITYTPDNGFEGVDTFEYSICSSEYPNLCDVATVTVRVTDCATTSSENLITGVVYVEQLPDDGVYNGEATAAGVQVDLLADLNCNGVIDSNESVIESTVTDLSGNYTFSVRNGFNAKDNFNQTASFTGNAGGLNWSSNWIEQNDDGAVGSGYVRIMADAVPDGEGNAIRISGNMSGTRGISRSMTFAGATSAALRFRYRRLGLDNNGEELQVLVNGSTVLVLNDGDNVGTDINYLNIVYPLANFNANGTNTVLFRTNSNVNTDDYYWVDDVELVYFKGDACYLVQVDPANTGGAYSASTLNIQEAHFTGLGVCERLNNLGVLANLIASDDQVNAQTDVPLNINVLQNDVIGKPDPATVTVTGVSNQPAHGSVTVNPDGTITYIPNPGYTGTDDFEYQVCSLEDPQICDVGLVNVNVSCISTPGKNSITGMVFSDFNVNGNFDTGETGMPGVEVHLFRDLNGNGSLDAGETVTDITNTSSLGSYVFHIVPEANPFTYLDNFNSNTTPNQSNGTASWTSSWTKIGETGTFGQNDITITSANGLRIQTVANTVKGAYRTVNLGAAIRAELSFKYTESGLDLDVNDFVDVQVANAASPSSWTLLKRISGADGNQSEILSFDITDYISSSTTIRFVTNSSASMLSGNIVYFDDVQVAFDVPVAEKYIVRLGQPIPAGYSLASPLPSPDGIIAVSFAAAGEGSCRNNFALTGLPVAKEDVNTTFTNTAISGNVLTNDKDPENHPLTVTAQTGLNSSGGGTYTLGTGGIYTYTPAPGFSGKDTLTYEVCNSYGQCAVSLVVIDVIPAFTGGNDAPIAVNDAYQGLVNNLVKGNVAANDMDPEGNPDPASVTLTGPMPNVLTEGVLSMNSDGTFIFAPVTGFTGQLTFTYSICDTGTPVYCDEAVATIDVLPASGLTAGTFAADDAFLGEGNDTIRGDVTLNDYDMQEYNQTVGTTPVVAPQHGTLTLNADGTFTYVPVPGYHGTDSFVYEICNDGSPQSCDKATVYLNVYRYYRSCIISNKMVTVFLK